MNELVALAAALPEETYISLDVLKKKKLIQLTLSISLGTPRQRYRIQRGVSDLEFKTFRSTNLYEHTLIQMVQEMRAKLVQDSTL